MVVGKQADDDAGHHHRCQEVEAVAEHLGAGQVGVGVGQATEERRAEDDGVADVHDRVAGQHRCEESPRPPPRQRHDDQAERRDVEGLDEALLHASKGDPLQRQGGEEDEQGEQRQPPRVARGTGGRGCGRPGTELNGHPISPAYRASRRSTNAFSV